MFNIILLGITSFLNDISSEMVYPVLSVYLVTQLGASPAILGFIEGVAESAASLLKVFFGYFSDRLRRRKPFAILGYGLSCLGKFFLIVSSSWGFVFVARLIDRVGKGIRVAPRDALIAESSSDGKRGMSFGIHRTMDTLGAVLGVLLTIYFIQYYHGDFKKIFLLSLIPAVMGIAVLFKVKEKRIKTGLDCHPREGGCFPSHQKMQHFGSRRLQPAQVTHPKGCGYHFGNNLEGGNDKGSNPFHILKNFRSLDRRLKMFLLITFLFNLGNFSNQFLLLRAKDLGFSLLSVVVMYLVYNLSYALTAYPAGKISDTIGRKKILIIGYLFYGLVYFGFAVIGSDILIWILFGIYGVYMGFTEGVEKAFVSDIAPASSRATLIGLHATLAGIALFPASLLAGLLWDIAGASAPFWFGGAMGILASAGLAVLI